MIEGDGPPERLQQIVEHAGARSPYSTCWQTNRVPVRVGMKSIQ
jgi:hypothetical protein